MKKLLWLLPLVVLLFAGFRSTGYRSDNTIVGDMTFEDSITMDELVVQNRATFEDDIETDGFIRNARLQSIDSIPADSVTGYVTFTFDDGTITHYDSIFPMFTDSGAVGVLAIYTQSAKLGGTTDWTRIKEMYAAGWEIASHTVAHAYLTGITADSADWELRRSQEILSAQGIVVKSFAYPGGAHNELVRRLTAKYYNCARTGASGGIGREPSPVNTFALKSIALDQKSNVAAARAHIDTAATNRSWVIFVTHAISGGTGFDIPLDSIAKMINYAKGKGLKIVTLQQGLEYMGNKIEVGDGKFRVGKDGELRANYSTTTFINIVGTTWMGGAQVASATQYYYNSNGADDTLYSGVLDLPTMYAGDSVRIDSMIITLNTTGNEDSVRVVLQRGLYSGFTNVDSVCNVGGGTSGNAVVNILQNGLITPLGNGGYRLAVKCKNNGNYDILITNYVKVFWRPE